MRLRLPLMLAVAGLVGAGLLGIGFTAYADQGSDNDAQQTHRGFVPSPADRAAFLDARIAALHAGLELSADQEKLWPPVESAIRAISKTIADERANARSEGRPADPIARLQRISANQIERGQALKKLADAASPLYAALNDEQKHRLPALLRASHLGIGHHQRRFAMNEGWRDRGVWRGHWDHRGDFGGGDEDHDGGH